MQNVTNVIMILSIVNEAFIQCFDNVRSLEFDFKNVWNNNVAFW